MSNPHEIFVTIEDHWNWDKYIEQCDLIELSVTDRQRAKDSFKYLRGVLGEGYLKAATSYLRGEFNQRNPLFSWYFANSAPRARLSMIEFVEALGALENAANFKAVLRRIKKRIKKPEDLNDLAEGISVIEVAHKFFQAGFDVEFEPSVSVPNHLGVVGIKKPDIKIINTRTGEEIFVEVSRMRASDHQNLTEHTYDVIWNVLVDEGMHSDPEALKDILHPRYILPYALIHRGIENHELKGIVSKIRELIDQVRTSGKFDQMNIPDTIEVGIASYDDHDRAREWAAERGIRETSFVEGPNILSNEIARAKVKLRDKVKQLPQDRPGIVVIPSSENLIFFVYDMGSLARALAEEAEKYPKLLSAIMFHTFDDGRDDSGSVRIDGHTFTRQIRSDKSVEQSLIVRNRMCNQSVSAETQKMVDSAFVV
jgi:hypothetical protein